MGNQTDKLLKNMTELALSLGRPFVFVKRMKYAGFPMPGGVATVAWALEWLKAHPEFKQSDWTKPRRGDGHPPASGVGK